MRATKWRLAGMGVWMLAMAWRWVLQPTPWRAWGCAALGLCWLGDAMRLPESPMARHVRDPFARSMGCFALGLAAYGRAFWLSMCAHMQSGMRLPGMGLGMDWFPEWLVVFLLACLAVWTVDVLPAERPIWLKAVALLYGILLATMSACACSASWTGVTFEPILWLATALWAISHGLRVRELFRRRIVRHQLDWVWWTYALAQICLGLGLGRI